MTQVYVCGLAFNEDLTKVALLLKNKGPKGVVGKWNGVGGRVRQGEGFRSAMSREFKEEAGVSTKEESWYGFYTFRYRNGSICHFYTQRMSNADFQKIKTMEEEPVSIFDTDDTMFQAIQQQAGSYIHPHLAFLLPMAHQQLHFHESDWNIGY